MTDQKILAAPELGGLDLVDLHEANIARQAEWCPEQVPDLSFRGNELAGETGEACNVIKKLERERHGWRGSRETVAHLAEELADVVICADLCAITAGVDLASAVRAKFNATSEKQGLSVFLRTTAPALPVDAGEGRVSAETFEQKTERNGRVQLRYDELMAAGKHGHYETMFRVVREEVERALRLAAAPQPTGVSPAQDALAALKDSIVDRLFGPNGRGWPTILDLCFTAFMNRGEPNPDDGGPSDWFNDTKPKIEALSEKMRASVEAEFATLAQHQGAGQTSGGA